MATLRWWFPIRFFSSLVAQLQSELDAIDYEGEDLCPLIRNYIGHFRHRLSTNTQKLIILGLASFHLLKELFQLTQVWKMDPYFLLLAQSARKYVFCLTLPQMAWLRFFPYLQYRNRESNSQRLFWGTLIQDALLTELPRLVPRIQVLVLPHSGSLEVGLLTHDDCQWEFWTIQCHLRCTFSSFIHWLFLERHSKNAAFTWMYHL